MADWLCRPTRAVPTMAILCGQETPGPTIQITGHSDGVSSHGYLSWL